MKKTLVALAVTAFAASSASAFTAYDNEGTKVDVSGRITLITDNVSTKVKGQKADDKHTKVWNDGSRLRIDASHQINDDLKAFSALEMRFDGNAGTNNFGNARAHRAYIGLDSATLGRISLGQQLLIGDAIGRIGLDNVYGVGTLYGDILTESAKSGIEYTYKGVPGLTLAANYVFADDREQKEDDFDRKYRDEVNPGKLKSGFGFGAIYEFDAGPGKASVAAGYSREHYKHDVKEVSPASHEIVANATVASGFSIKDVPAVTATDLSSYKYKDGVFVGANYAINGLKVGIDYGFASFKPFEGKADKLSYLRTGARYDVTDAVGVYGNYSYQTFKAEESKDTVHRFMLGTDYKLHKNVKTFLEARFDRVKPDSSDKYTDRYVGVGAQVFW
ncbi:hypothetical protein BMT54_11610 [Pasteurellaceae bacterium 15-036681]|nr:hypothetical protein BMT54_11610 [Pasteurellaceae bacterium 15-036681]